MKIPFNLVNIDDIFGNAEIDGDYFPSTTEYRRYLSQVCGISCNIDTANNLNFDFNNEDLTQGKIFNVLDIVLPDFDYSKLLYVGTRYSPGTLNGPSLRDLQSEVKRFGIPQNKFRVFRKFDVWFIFIDWDPYWVTRKLAIDAGKVDSRTWISS